MFEIKCTDCGKPATVPFKPTAGKPVYCKTCFEKHTFKPRENVGVNFSFDPNQAWARRGNNWQGMKEKESTSVFH